MSPRLELRDGSPVVGWGSLNGKTLHAFVPGTGRAEYNAACGSCYPMPGVLRLLKSPPAESADGPQMCLRCIALLFAGELARLPWSQHGAWAVNKLLGDGIEVFIAPAPDYRIVLVDTLGCASVAHRGLVRLCESWIRQWLAAAPCTFCRAPATAPVPGTMCSKCHEARKDRQIPRNLPPWAYKRKPDEGARP